MIVACPSETTVDLKEPLDVLFQKAEIVLFKTNLRKHFEGK
jgi:hypothetical protein